VNNEEDTHLTEAGFGADSSDSLRGTRRRHGGGGFVKQAAILGGASIFVRLLGFFYRVPLTNLIGDEGNDFYGSAYQIYAFALTLTSAFMIATISRLTSERLALGQYRNAHSLFKTAMIFSMVMGIAGSLAMFFGAEFIEKILNFREGTAYAIRAVSPAVFIVSLLTVFRGYFQGMKTTSPTAISQVIEQIFNVSFSLILAFWLFDVAAVQFSAAGAAGGTAIAALAALGVVMFVYALVARALKKRASEDESEPLEKRRTQLAAIVKTAFPIMIGLSILSVTGILDISMANSRLEASEAFSEGEISVMVGQFLGKFVLLTTLPASLSMAISSAVIPEITAAHVTLDDKAVKQKTNLALRLSMMLAMPSAVGLAILADPILALLFPLHPHGGLLLLSGAVSIVFLSVVHVTTGVLQGVGRVKLPVIGLVFGVGVKIILNYFLMAIPSINILGGVISTIACFAVAAIINLFFLRRVCGIFPEFIPTFLKPFIAAAGMGLVCFSSYHLINIYAGNTVSTLSALVLSVFAYVILMILIKGFGERELNLLPIPRKLRRLFRY
jgi:stage V sporulation protein B